MRPFGALEWAIALRYLRSRRREAFISVISTLSLIGIALGVATLIIVMAVMNGFRAELFNKILGVSGHVLLQPLDGPLTDYREVAKRIDAIDGVVRAIPFVEGQVLVSGPANAGGALVRGLTKEDFDRLDFVSDRLLLGSDEEFGTQKGAIIGSRLARALGVTIGDTIQLISPKGAVTPFGVTPRIDSYPVQAIFEIGMSEYDSTFIYIPLERAQLYFNQEGTVTAIEVYAEDPDDMDALRQKIIDAAERPLFIVDWRQRNQTFFSALVVERNVMFIILTLIILVAALNVVSGMTMLVKEKTRDIAILRTIGATRGSVLRVFLIVGLSIGVVGTLIGLVLGTLIALNIEAIRQGISSLLSMELFSPELYFLSRMPADMDSVETTAVVVMALLLSLLATIYPAWKAAKTDPVVSLKAE
ncbi:lipoprotein-releasing ABC transporter permease subunit [Acuticoccus mangrovi]|uniref:Lipoprotein-releasing ABC transporter permease subunit n=1 Tax=Acuticoccus mangrovi TaxID=2796142 RepID=A0A934IDA9_9HYPH|nr:lipoprotein-releasing ABC transporter permease subunit [Acuticoccus mangrovi]